MQNISQTLPSESGNTPAAPIGNNEFLWALARALITLGVSAAILIAAYITFPPGLAAYRKAAGSADIRPRTILGSDLIVRLGAGGTSGDNALHLEELSKDGRAIVTRNISLLASNYPFVEYKITDRHPGEIVYLLWKTAENPEDVSRVQIYWSGDITTSFHLGKEKAWKGRIIEIGFDIYGDLREQPLVISSLALLPATRASVISSTLSQWAAFRGWTQKSAHHLRGTPLHSNFSPVLLLAIWSGLSLVILAAHAFIKQNNNLISYAAVIVVPWLTLDLLWQSNLSTQLEETKLLFSGKTQHEKHLADRESDLYQYTDHLKREVLPEPGARIFLLHDTPHKTYKRLKAQYYLLPQNVFNYDRFPRKGTTREDDYILVLGKIGGLKYSPEADTLNWNGESIAVKLIDTHPLGHVYHVMAADN